MRKRYLLIGSCLVLGLCGCGSTSHDNSGAGGEGGAGKGGRANGGTGGSGGANNKGGSAGETTGGLGAAGGDDGLGELTDAQRAAVQRLGEPLDTTVAQPEQMAGLTELTLAELDAYCDKVQSQNDTLGDMSAERSMRIQMFQDRYAKFLQTLSNMLKKASDVDSGIIANMK